MVRNVRIVDHRRDIPVSAHDDLTAGSLRPHVHPHPLVVLVLVLTGRIQGHRVVIFVVIVN